MRPKYISSLKDAAKNKWYLNMAMQQSRLERENLEAHVDLCAERYRVLEENLKRLESKVDNLADSVTKIVDKQAADKSANSKLVLGAAATIIMGLISTVVLLLLNLQGMSGIAN